MINKYAEIKDRLLLYNACKGILRVKTAGWFSTLADIGGKAGNAVGGKSASFMNWLTSDATQKGITGFTNALKLGGTLAQTGGQVMGAVNTANQMGAVNAQNAIEARKAALEQARLDMLEHKLNQQRQSLGLGAVSTRNGAAAQSETGDEDMQQGMQEQAPQQQLQQ